LNMESTLRWKNVHFNFFPWKRNTLFENYWALTGQNVSILNFKHYKLSCTEMVKFLNAMPQLLEVTFNQCSFETTKMLVPGKPKITYLRSCCPHTNLVIGANDTPVPPPLIRVLKLSKADSFPMCLLDLLHQRSNGTLQVFHFNHARMATWKCMYYRPTRESVLAFVTQIIRSNVATLREFNFYRNFRGDLFLNQLTALNINIAPEIVSIGQQASWRFMETAPGIIQYIESLDADRLRKLTLRFIHRFSGTNLGTAIATKINLRSLILDFVWSDSGIPLDLAALLPHLQHLEEVHVRDRNRRRQPSILDTFLTELLPMSVKSIGFYGYYIPEDKIKTFVQSVSARRLHTLNIEGGRYITDETFQLIIKTLPQLEVLGVNDSRYLTDAGLTGLPAEGIKQILKCQQRVILTEEFELDDDLPGVSVSQMRNLRKLSLCGCRKLSDITVFVGIKFPYLREIDLSRCLNVTDIGIIQLSKNNPSLERIVIMKNLKITHFGLNQVLIHNQCIANIHTSKKVRDRKLGKQIPYTVCDRFNTAVTYSRWDERRARPMFSD